MNDFSLRSAFLRYTHDEWARIFADIPAGIIEALNFALRVDNIAGNNGTKMDWDRHAHKWVAQERGCFGLFNLDAFQNGRVIETHMNRVWNHKLRFDGSWCLVHLDGAPCRLPKIHTSICEKIIPYDKLLRDHMPESFWDNTCTISPPICLDEV